MKKEFFNPADVRFVNPITGRSYRANRSLRHGSACFKTDGEKDDDPEAEALLKKVRATTIDELEKRGVKTGVVESFNTFMLQAEKLPIEALRALADDKTGVLALVKEMGLKIEALETRGAKGDKPLTIRAQIEKYRTDNKDILDQIRSKKQPSSGLPAFELNIRAANSPMTVANTITGAPLPNMIDFDPNLNDIPRFDLTFWDYIVKGRSDKETYMWINKTNPQGAAGFIGPGELKPGISFQVVKETSNAKKVAVSDKQVLELFDDVSGFESWVKDELIYQLRLAVNTAAMTSDGSDPDSITGIQHLSVAFTKAGLATTNPTYADALRSVVAQMRTSKLNGQIVVFINPVDGANMDMAKATTSGVYMLPAFVTSDGKTIAGAAVIEDNNIPAGYFQAAFLRYYVIKIYKDMYITFGWEMDDFTKNLITYLCEMRLHQLFNTQYTGAFVYDTFINVLALIAA